MQCLIGERKLLNQINYTIMEAAIILITLSACLFGIFYMHFTTRNKERLALIEKGADASMFKIGREPLTRASSGRGFNSLKVGLFLIGGGLGTLAGYFVGRLGMHEGASYPSMILLFAGLGLLVYYMLVKEKKD